MSTPGERLARARAAKGYETAKSAAEAMGVAVSTYVQHENGIRGVPAARASKYARFYGVTPEWLLYGRETPAKPPPSAASVAKARRRGSLSVPLVGYVGAGAEAHYYATGDELGEVDAPEGSTPHTVAVEVRGQSLGPLFERWLIFYDEVRTPPTPDLFGRLCIVGLPDDRILVKQIRPATTAGFFHLLSNNEPPITDQEVMWAARVKSMTPR